LAVDIACRGDTAAGAAVATAGGGVVAGAVTAEAPDGVEAVAEGSAAFASVADEAGLGAADA
jgi:hypothetical protein